MVWEWDQDSMSQIFERKEKKYIITKEQMNQIKNLISDFMEPDEYSLKNGFYTIYNIYYDNKYDDIIRTSVEKPIYKEKLRVRSYNLHPSNNDTIYIEIKKKFNGIGNKRRIALSYDKYNDLVYKNKQPLFDNYVDNEIYEEISEFIKRTSAIPKIFISYNRIAYKSNKIKQFRITFDFNMKYRLTKLNFESNDGVSIIDDNLVIMEIKFLNAMPFEILEILNRLNIQKHSFSKVGKVHELLIKGEYKNVN